LTGPVFVQFPHPGSEHNPGKAARQPWNKGKHRRKFLRCTGRYADGDGATRSALVVFWGEWEPPSYVIKQWSKDGHLPRFLHDPVWEYSTDREPRQNTDPWVFGDCFVYSNCKQLSQYALRTLTRGTVILFGSGLNADFVLDTVFVVRDSQRLLPKHPPKVDEPFRVCTIEPLASDAKCSGDAFVLYRGATFDAPVEGMYSFVPCRPADCAGPRFLRPAITLAKEYLNPSSTQTPRARPRSLAQVQDQWEAVRRQVINASCSLGVSFSTPPLDDASRTGHPA
jgi:hypothetical protein